MGSRWPDSIGGQHPTKGQRQVLQGSSAVGPSLQQQDVEPYSKCTDAVGGVPYPSGLP